MKAAIYTRYGPPEVVQLAEVEKPQPKPDEMLIKVHASTVNRTDCGFRSAEYFISRLFSGLLKPRNKILGNEFAGEVEAIGDQVTQFNVGDRVFGYDDKHFGAHAEYKVIKETAGVTTIPTGLSYEEAAPMLEGAHYALGDIRAAKVQAGQSALVNGGTGAIGSAAVQLLKAMGATVTAVCATQHLELVKALGADRVVDYTVENFTKLDETFHLVFDAVGKSSFKKCRPLLKNNGIYVSTELGYLSQNIFLALVTPVFGGKKVLFPLPNIHKDDVLFLKGLAEAGKYKPLIDRSYTLDQIVEAHEYVETGQKVGNVIIKIGC